MVSFSKSNSRRVVQGHSMSPEYLAEGAREGVRSSIQAGAGGSSWGRRKTPQGRGGPAHLAPALAFVDLGRRWLPTPPRPPPRPLRHRPAAGRTGVGHHVAEGKGMVGSGRHRRSGDVCRWQSAHLVLMRCMKGWRRSGELMICAGTAGFNVFLASLSNAESRQPPLSRQSLAAQGERLPLAVGTTRTRRPSLPANGRLVLHLRVYFRCPVEKLRGIQSSGLLKRLPARLTSDL